MAKAAKTRAPEGRERVGGCEAGGFLGLLLEVESGSLADHTQGHRCNLADAGNLSQVRGRGVEDCTEIPEALEQRLCGGFYVSPGDAEREQELDNLVLCKASKPGLQKSLPKALPVPIMF